VNHFELLAAAGRHGGRYSNAAVLLILGLFTLFLSVAVSMRGSTTRDIDEPDDVEPDASFEVRSARDWFRGERRRARMARRLRPVLATLGVGLVLASVVAALITWY
jgi:hypothetical protein